MKPKRFITSKFYELPELHTLNTYLKSLEPSNLDKNKIEEIIGLLAHYESFYKLTDYVPGSPKHNQIIEQNKQYDEAQSKLKEYKYSKEIILDEIYTDLSCLIKHSITFIKEEERSEWTSDDEYENYTVKVDFVGHFYTKSYDKISINPSDYCLSYSKKGKGYNAEEKDYIAEFIEKHKRTTSRLFCYTTCTEQGWDVKLFMRTFDIHKLSYYSDVLGGFVYIKIEAIDKEYHSWDVKNIMQEAEEAFGKKYIREDKYVDYPSYLSYLDFVKLLESGEYKSC